jgi:cadmium resistance transport/sequestration family protein
MPEIGGKKMSGLVTAVPTGITAFAATNLDDLVILAMFFSQVNSSFRRRHIVFGQYLGFIALLIASLPGFFGGLILPRHLIGLLGLLPIAIGLNRLLDPETESSSEATEQTGQSESSPLGSLLSPQTYNVAAITIANGSDNIGIYMPLFANSALESLLIIVSIFLLLVGVWCYITYKLTQLSAIANLLEHLGNSFVPYVLIGLGVLIILDSNALIPQALVAVCLCFMGLIKLNAQEPKIKEN